MSTRTSYPPVMLFLMPVLVAPVVSDSCNPVDCSPPGSSVCGILQARIWEYVVISFSRGSSQPRSPTLQADSLPSEPESPIKYGEWNQSNRTKCHFVFKLNSCSQTLKRVYTRADNSHTHTHTHTLEHPWLGRWEEKVEQNEPFERGSVRGQGRRMGQDFSEAQGVGEISHLRRGWQSCWSCGNGVPSRTAETCSPL